MTPEETVDAFIGAVTGGDMARAAELAAEDIVYENVGFAATEFVPALPTMHGSSAMVELLAGMEDADWEVHRQMASGTMVVNERTDRFTFNGTRIELAVAGIFEVVDGRISLWRDYVDMQALTDQLSGS